MKKILYLDYLVFISVLGYAIFIFKKSCKVL